MKIILDEGAFMPERAHFNDAGLDIKAVEDAVIMPHSSVIFHTGVHVELPLGHAGVLMSKSGLNVKHDLTSTGLIDESYQGEIVVKLYNNGNKAYKVHRGDKISQLMVVPVVYETLEQVDDFGKITPRGDNGFGSTGR